jgi:2-methylcitrate dehydratase PrpD
MKDKQESILKIAEFVTSETPPGEARRRAAVALCDTAGVILAGAGEAAADIVRRVIAAESRGRCRILGTAGQAGAADAALANGVAAQAVSINARISRAGLARGLGSPG